MSNKFNRPWRSGGIFLAASALLMGLFVLLNYQRGPAQTGSSTFAAGKGNPIVLHGQLLGGGRLNTARWKGKVIVVDFWGTWCPWCVKEAPHIAKLYAKYHHHGLEVLGVPLNDTTAAVRRYRKENPNETWPQLQDTHNSNEAIAQHLGIQGLPTELVIDRQGVLKHVLVGYAPQQLAADVRKLVAPAQPGR